ncbi:MAG: hypothetical protein IJD22_08135 [Clostridia bacterium]|nr:hypothetical protein [Clostridia bacterium]
MKRPYIICHMVVSLDGKVTGEFLSRPEAQQACSVYYEINRELRCNGFICGRVTMESSFTGGYYPELCGYDEILEKTDFVPESLSAFMR